MQMYEHILSELGPWCLAEQDLCVRFFNLTTNDDSDASSPPHLVVSDVPPLRQTCLLKKFEGGNKL